MKQHPLPLEQIASTLAPFCSGLSEGQLTAIQTYVEKLLQWNDSIALTSVEERPEIVARHFGESIFAASLVDMRVGRLADVGSGAGFPGLPLKIAIPELRVALLEPNIKKAAFLTEMKMALDLSGVDVVRSRYENLSVAPPLFDFVASRALGGYKQLLSWAKNAVKQDGRVILWLGTDDSIAIGRTKGWTWELPVLIPESRRRVILVGRPAQ